jgi:hypothetical protein
VTLPPFLEPTADPLGDLMREAEAGAGTISAPATEAPILPIATIPEPGLLPLTLLGLAAYLTLRRLRPKHRAKK